MASWEFLPNLGNEEEGLGHAGIETFKGSRYPGIARECSQNSLDAAATLPNGTSQAVHLVFRRLLLSAENIPDLPTLKKTLHACLEQAHNLHRHKDRAFFEHAIKLASRAQIPVLSIEDYGTTGLIGPAIAGNPFYALVKSSGVSQKTNDDAGGSFGIGKNAAFAVSDLRTVFYSTLYESTEKKHLRLAQGKSILVSHEDNSKNAKRATGYWGDKGFNPVQDNEEIPDWLRRSQNGTTVASIGFTEESSWHWQMVESLVRNFFAAIREGAIRFTVQQSEEEKFEIDSKNLSSLFDHPEVLNAAETAGTSDDLKFSAAMLEALNSPDTQAHEKEFKDIGTFRIRILQSKELPRRVGILRNGMYIANNLKHFNHPLARFPLSKDFVAVLEPGDRETSRIIRDMENPKHDEFSAERIDDVSRRENLRRSMRNVGTWVREIIKAETEKATEEEILLDEMNRFFSQPNEGQSIPDSSAQNDDPEKVRLSPKIIKIRPIGAGKEGDSGSSGGKKESKIKKGKTSGEGEGKGRGSNGGRGGRNHSYHALRNSIPFASKGDVRVIAFTPESEGTALLELSAVGVHKDEALVIKSINGNLCASNPMLELQENIRVNVTVHFQSPYTGPIKMVLSRIEDSLDAN